MADIELSDLRNSAFATLVNVVREWRAAERVTTSAGVKPPFVEAMNGKTEQDLGYETWREFIEAAAAANYIQTVQLATKHTGILLPGEDEVVVAAWATKRSQARRGSSAAPPTSRLKPDVWAAFVEWRDGHRRLWDSTACRAVVYPVDESGEPAWVAGPDRFCEIEAVTAETQKDWMREWAAAAREPDDCEALLAALALDAPLGSFRRVLEERGLTLQWHAELNRRVRHHIREWAQSHGIAWHDLAIHTTKGAAPPPRLTHRQSRQGGGTTSLVNIEGRTKRAAGDSDLERLREIVRRAVDRMSYAELASIPIRAEHLLGDR